MYESVTGSRPDRSGPLKEVRRMEKTYAAPKLVDHGSAVAKTLGFPGGSVESGNQKLTPA